VGGISYYQKDKVFLLDYMVRTKKKGDVPGGIFFPLGKPDAVKELMSW